MSRRCTAERSRVYEALAVSLAEKLPPTWSETAISQEDLAGDYSHGQAVVEIARNVGAMKDSSGEEAEYE